MCPLYEENLNGAYTNFVNCNYRMHEGLIKRGLVPGKFLPPDFPLPVNLYKCQHLKCCCYYDALYQINLTHPLFLPYQCKQY